MRRRSGKARYWQTIRKAEIDMIEWAVREAGSIKGAAVLLEVGMHFLYKRCVALELQYLYKAPKKDKTNYAKKKKVRAAATPEAPKLEPEP